MSLTLEEIIVNGLDEKLRETSYRSKIFVGSAANAADVSAAPQFSVPSAVADDKCRHKSQDSSNSPGDSDYESAQVILEAIS
jgi:hypothetical protein